MSRMKSMFAISLLIAISGMVPQAFATTPAPVPAVKAVIAGSSALWQTVAIATYNNHTTTAGTKTCPAGAVSPCFHFTAKNFQLTDSRPTSKGGSALTDTNTVWIIWDSHTTGTAGQKTPNVWAYIKVDSVVGQRCYFGHPRCKLIQPTGGFPTTACGSSCILTSLWGDSSADTVPDSTTGIPALFVAGISVSAAATDIRPEDGLYATCRANSQLGTGAVPKGLGYNSNNSPGVCAPGTGGTNAELTGTDMISLFNTANTAHVMAYAISGSDPYSGQTIPAYTVVPAGADPIVFVTKVTSTSSPLAGVTDVSDAQLQKVFGGTTCTGTALGGASGNIDAWLREPLSGTYNTIESNVFRYADNSGVSQEQGVDPTSGDNPLNQTCGTGGTRKRGVGTGDVISGLKANATDGITYTFFSYGNVGPLADSSSFRYLKLNGVDPIFHKYFVAGGAAPIDPGQPHGSTGEIPGAADSCTGSGFPCSENAIWTGGFDNAGNVTGHGLSFPTLRSGRYKAWSILRIISDGTALTNIQTIVAASQIYAATSTPDYVPVIAVAATADPGVALLRSHYQQKDAAGTLLGPAPVNKTTTAVSVGGHAYTALKEAGGDMGGCIMRLVQGTTAIAEEETDFTTGCAEN